MKRRVWLARRGPAVLLAVAVAAVACESDSEGTDAAGGAGADVAQGADAGPGGGVGADTGAEADVGTGGGDATGTTDAATDSGGGTVDTTQGTDGSADSGPVGACPGGCGDQACVAGACVASCGADPATLEAALGAGLVVLSNHCGDTTALVALAGLPNEGALALSAADEAGKARFALHRRSFDGQPPALLSTVDVDGSLAAFEVFPGGYLETDPTFTRAAWGYSTMGADFPGSVVVGDLVPGDPAALDAPGNYAVAFLDEDRLLVNGLGAAGVELGQGLYLVELGPGGPSATLVATNLGTASGDVAVHGDLVLAGGFAGFGTTWPDGSEGNRVYGLSVEALLAAASTDTPVDVFAAAPSVDIPGDFAFTPDGHVLAKTYDESYQIAGFQLIPLTVTEDGATAGPATALTVGPQFRLATPLPGTDRWALVHDAGTLVVGDAGD